MRDLPQADPDQPAASSDSLLDKRGWNCLQRGGHADCRNNSEGAVGMFSGILSSDSEMIVFERDVSDLFFSSVPAGAQADFRVADGGACRSGAFRHCFQRRPSDHHMFWRHCDRRPNAEG